jgi:hypothetical protein
MKNKILSIFFMIIGLTIVFSKSAHSNPVYSLNLVEIHGNALLTTEY